MNKRSRPIKWSHLVSKLLAQIWCVILPLTAKIFLMTPVTLWPPLNKANKTRLKKFARVIAWLLLLMFAANIFRVLIAPEVAQAAAMSRYPTGDISAAGTWAVYPASPTTKWDKVDETPHDTDTTYLTHGNTAGSALFSFSAFSIPTGSRITNLTVTVMARDVTSGTNKVQPAIRVNGTNYLTTSTSTEVPVNAAYGAISYAYTTNPNTTAAWTVADINGTGAAPLQGFGTNSADANPAFRITQVSAVVNYTTMAVSTDKGSYPTLGETISSTGTVYNNTGGNLIGTSIDTVIFIDTNGDHKPTAGETYMVSGCSSSAAWAANNYTFQTTGLTVNAGATYADNKSCANTNFPSNTTYTIWTRWYTGATIWAESYATFSSIPTLDEILFFTLIGLAVFLAYRQGYLKLGLTKIGLIKSTGKTNFLPPRSPQIEGKNLALGHLDIYRRKPRGQRRKKFFRRDKRPKE